jgi:energy-coupling factor transport system ATP-binding protein
LTYYYPDKKDPALKKVNLKIEEGEFILVTGGSGSGKSSLARSLAGLIPDFYGGKIGGKVLYKGLDLRAMDRRKIARNIGIVFQDPEKQLVMNSVEAEIVFGLENIGLDDKEMVRRLAEVVGFLNLSEIKDEFTGAISGGQKQKVVIASVLAMRPDVLILDEPTSQLDPANADEILKLVKSLNDEGITVVLIEQRLERCFSYADRVVVLDRGELLKGGTPGEIACWGVGNNVNNIPSVVKFFTMCNASLIPLDIKEGRAFLKKHLPEQTSSIVHQANEEPDKQTCDGQDEVLEIKNIWFSYPDGKASLQDINFTVKKGEIIAILGENAAGKTTLLKILAGLIKPGRGSVRILGNDPNKYKAKDIAGMIGYMPQNTDEYFFYETVEEEIGLSANNPRAKSDKLVNYTIDELGIKEFFQYNPRELSAGERVRVALASVLAGRPALLLLDEPTRGIDYNFKNDLGRLLLRYSEEGTAVIIVTNDIEFAAEYARRVILMFDGRIAGDGSKHEILGESIFFSTQMSRLFRGFRKNILTVREALEQIRFPVDIK